MSRHQFRCKAAAAAALRRLVLQREAGDNIVSVIDLELQIMVLCVVSKFRHHLSGLISDYLAGKKVSEQEF
jgi:hypothetical protein